MKNRITLLSVLFIIVLGLVHTALAGGNDIGVSRPEQCSENTVGVVTVSIDNHVGISYVDFPTPFCNNDVVVLVSPTGNNDNFSVRYMETNIITSDGFAVRVRTAEDDDATEVDVAWTAFAKPTYYTADIKR